MTLVLQQQGEMSWSYHTTMPFHKFNQTNVKGLVRTKAHQAAIVEKWTPVFKSFPSKNQSLLIRRNTFFVLNLFLDGIGRITGIQGQIDSFPSQSSHQDLLRL